MVPQIKEHTDAIGDQPTTQSLYIIRHGDRWDYAHPEWKKTAARPGDPSLSTLGFAQARQVGQYLDKVMVEENISADQIILLSSPFLRTIQTANELLSEMKCTKGNASENVDILLESSIFEFDLWGNDLHGSLPHDMTERLQYFPRVKLHHESSFVPELPEDKDQFLRRCDRAMECISDRYRDPNKHRVVILVSHAACCIGLAKAAAGGKLQDINAAAPCSIYRLERTIGKPGDGDTTNQWALDHYSKKDSMNGYTGHMERCDGKTIPWNHFGDKAVNNGWTGPPGMDPTIAS